MDASSWILGIVLGTALLAAVAPSQGSDLFTIDVHVMADLWDKEHISPPDPSTLKHADLKRQLSALATKYPSAARLEQAGVSTEGREIFLLSLGNGPQKILLWSQMHGDEATATSALIDLAHFLCSRRQETQVSNILEKYTLLFVPMLNPDGAERSQRRNAQGIDINRDARMLQTPEGRLLKKLRDQHSPFIGFNLHNQNSLTTVGDTGQVATIALLAVAADLSSDVRAVAGEALAPHQLLAKQATAVLFEALSPFVQGHISRYDESFNPRAFGDNLTLWGTPIVLIESGGNPADAPANFGVKLNFVGLLAVLDSLSSGRIRNADPAVFDALKMNSETPIYDLLLRNAWICTGTGVQLFKGDIAIRRDLRGNADGQSVIADIGDLGVFNAHQVIDCSGMMVSPGLIVWEPDVPVLGGRQSERAYLQQGIVSVLETCAWRDMQRGKPEPHRWRSAERVVNWGYVVAGGRSRMGAAQKLSLAEWLAAGARGWIVDPRPPLTVEEAGKIPAWFRIQAMSRETAEGFRAPSAMRGEPTSALRRWTSEAAMQFDLPGRGRISVGAIPDLVLWSTPSADTAPAELGDCKPVRVVVNGRLVDPNNPAPLGQFLGRP